MSETLVIRLPESGDEAAEWVVVDSDGAAIGATSFNTFSEIAEQRNGRRVYALLPATQVLRTSVNIPLKKLARIRQALPFALEEQLAHDVETQHFALGKRDTKGMIPVAVVATHLIDTWKSSLTDAGLAPDGLFAESDGLIVVPSTITVLADKKYSIVCAEDGEINIADADSLQTVLELMLDERSTDDDDAEAVPINILAYCGTDVQDSYTLMWEQLRLSTASLDVRILAEGTLPRLAAQIVTNGGINLLQGAYAPQSDYGIQWQPWRLAASLLGACVVLAVVFQGIQYWKHNSEEARLDQAAEQLLRTTFNDVTDVRDPWSQLRARLDASTGTRLSEGPGFAEAMEALAIAFAVTPGLRMETLSYRQGSLDLQLRAPDVAALDQLRQRITGPGKFSAEIQSANPDDKQIKGRVKITATGGG